MHPDTYSEPGNVQQLLMQQSKIFSLMLDNCAMWRYILYVESIWIWFPQNVVSLAWVFKKGSPPWWSGTSWGNLCSLLICFWYLVGEISYIHEGGRTGMKRLRAWLKTVLTVLISIMKILIHPHVIEQCFLQIFSRYVINLTIHLTMLICGIMSHVCIIVLILGYLRVGMSLDSEW